MKPLQLASCSSPLGLKKRWNLSFWNKNTSKAGGACKGCAINELLNCFERHELPNKSASFAYWSKSITYYKTQDLRISCESLAGRPARYGALENGLSDRADLNSNKSQKMSRFVHPIKFEKPVENLKFIEKTVKIWKKLKYGAKNLRNIPKNQKKIVVSKPLKILNFFEKTVKKLNRVWNHCPDKSAACVRPPPPPSVFNNVRWTLNSVLLLRVVNYGYKTDELSPAPLQIIINFLLPRGFQLETKRTPKKA